MTIDLGLVIKTRVDPTISFYDQALTIRCIFMMKPLFGVNQAHRPAAKEGRKVVKHVWVHYYAPIT